MSVVHSPFNHDRNHNFGSRRTQIFQSQFLRKFPIKPSSIKHGFKRPILERKREPNTKRCTNIAFFANFSYCCLTKFHAVFCLKSHSAVLIPRQIILIFARWACGANEYIFRFSPTMVTAFGEQTHSSALAG